MIAEVDAQVAALLRDAAEWRLLALLFRRPSPEWREELRAGAAELTDPALARAAEAALDEAEDGVHFSIFGPGGPAPPREASYRTTLQLGYVLAEIEAYYGAFGFAPPDGEPPDHVAVEAEFVSYLRLKEALAHAAGDDERASIAAAAARDFLGEHLSRVAQPLSEGLPHSGVSYLALAAQALAERTGPAPPAYEPAADLVQIEDAVVQCGEGAG